MLDRFVFRLTAAAPRLPGKLSDQLPQNVRQDASVPIVMHLVRSIDSGNGFERSYVARFVVSANRDALSRFDVAGHALDIKDFKTSKAQTFSIVPLLELQRENTHADEIASMDTFKAFRQHRLHAQQPRTFCSPVA